MELKKLIQNLDTKEPIDCEVILGKSAYLADFARFWLKHGDELMLVATKKLTDYATERDYESKEMKAYREGLLDIGKFFYECYAEYDKKQKELESQNEAAHT